MSKAMNREMKYIGSWIIDHRTKKVHYVVPELLKAITNSDVREIVVFNLDGEFISKSAREDMVKKIIKSTMYLSSSEIMNELSWKEYYKENQIIKDSEVKIVEISVGPFDIFLYNKELWCRSEKNEKTDDAKMLMNVEKCAYMKSRKHQIKNPQGLNHVASTLIGIDYSTYEDYSKLYDTKKELSNIESCVGVVFDEDNPVSSLYMQNIKRIICSESATKYTEGLFGKLTDPLNEENCLYWRFRFKDKYNGIVCSVEDIFPLNYMVSTTRDEFVKNSMEKYPFSDKYVYMEERGFIYTPSGLLATIDGKCRCYEKIAIKENDTIVVDQYVTYYD